jgi:hypothetical protein
MGSIVQMPISNSEPTQHFRWSAPCWWARQGLNL